MILHTLWGVRNGDSTPELMVAWDDYTVDGNREGFMEDCERAIKSWGADLREKRYINIQIDEVAVSNAFDVVEVNGKVKR